MKEKTRVARGKSPVEFGDSWTFYGIERETKLILAHQVGQRDSDTCWAFLLKLKAAIGTGRFQLTTDGLAAYRKNVPFAFQSQVDFAELIKNLHQHPRNHPLQPGQDNQASKSCRCSVIATKIG